MNSKLNYKIAIIFQTAILTLIGLILFKYIPMYLYGEYILYDASSHMAWTSFGLYTIWLIINHIKKIKVPYIIISALILVGMAIQRILSYNHNVIGVLLGLIVALVAIIIPRYDKITK